MSQNEKEPQVVLVALDEQQGLEWLDSHNLDPEGVHIVTDAEGFREHVRNGGLNWRMAHDDEGAYVKTLPEMLRREIDRWLFHHQPKRRAIS